MINTISLLEDLIRIPSDPGNVKAAKQILERILSELDSFTIERFTKNSVESALVYNQPKRPDKFKVILNAHLDVIPGKPHQYSPKRLGNKLYGVGSMDMKASVACLVTSFRTLANQVPYAFALQLTTDEEVGGFNGTQHQINEGVKAEFVLAGEPTNFDIVHMAKGIIQAKVIVHGQSAHGAYPWHGTNAIWQMHQFLSDLNKKFPTPSTEAWVTTVNVAHINAPNESFNKVPDICEAWLDIRFVPHDSTRILPAVKQILPPGSTIKILFNEPALQTAPDDPFVAALSAATARHTGTALKLRGANGTSDARHYGAEGCPGVEFGPIGGGIGADNEWVDLESLNTYQHIIKDFLQSIKP